MFLCARFRLQGCRFTAVLTNALALRVCSLAHLLRFACRRRGSWRGCRRVTRSSARKPRCCRACSAPSSAAPDSSTQPAKLELCVLRAAPLCFARFVLPGVRFGRNSRLRFAHASSRFPPFANAQFRKQVLENPSFETYGGPFGIIIQFAHLYI